MWITIHILNYATEWQIDEIFLFNSVVLFGSKNTTKICGKIHPFNWWNYKIVTLFHVLILVLPWKLYIHVAWSIAFHLLKNYDKKFFLNKYFSLKKLFYQLVIASDAGNRVLSSGIWLSKKEKGEINILRQRPPILHP